LNTKGKPALEKFSMALEKGLADLAAQTAEEAAGEMNDPKGQRDVAREVTVLLLNLGRLDKARDVPILDPEVTAGQPAPPNYLDLHLRLAAANGDYEQADRLLADALNYAWKNPAGRPAHFPERMRIGAAIGSVLMGEAQHLTGAPQLPAPPWLAPTPSDYSRRRWRLDALTGALLIEQQRVAWCMLRGWLAVEAGRCVEARGDFQDALDKVTLPRRWTPEVERLKVLIDAESDPLRELAVRQEIVRSLSRQYLKWLKTSPR
jgi:hypothetical protein